MPQIEESSRGGGFNHCGPSVIVSPSSPVFKAKGRFWLWLMVWFPSLIPLFQFSPVLVYHSLLCSVVTQPNSIQM